MNVYSISDGNITSSLFDLVEADSAAILLTHTPTTRIMGLDKSKNDLYYFDGQNWELVSGGIVSGATPNIVTGLYAEVGSTLVQLTWNSEQTANYYKVYQITSGSESLASLTSATSLTVSGLTNGVVYGFRIVATNSFGDSESTTYVYATPQENIPGTVGTISASNIFTTSATLTWPAVSQAISYIVYLTPLSGTEIIAASPTQPSVDLTLLTSNTQYSVQIAAVSLGGEGFLSSPLIFNTLIDIPSVVETISISTSDTRLILNWTSADRASSYRIMSGTTSASLSELTITSATSLTVSGLTNGVEYFFAIYSLNSTGSSVISNIFSGTPTISNFTVYSQPELTTSFSGMMMNTPPDDGPFSTSGVTYGVSFGAPKNITSVGYYDYVDLTFANLSTSAASGMVIACKKNDPWVAAMATTSAAITQDINTGFLSAAVDIPPAVNGISTTTVRIPLGNGQFTGSTDLGIRFYIPKSQETTYARTFTTCGDSAYSLGTIFKSFSISQFDLMGLPLSWLIDIARAEGDAIRDQTIALNESNWVKSADGFGAYDPPLPSSIPWMSVRWHMVGLQNVKIFELVGDSIAQGYGNNGNALNVEGISQVVNKANVAVSATNWILNYGQSGFTPEQYLARWEGIAKTTSATALIYSIFSPNGYFDNGQPIYSRIEDMKNNCILAEQKAEQYGRVFIPCFITNTNMFQLNTTPASAASHNSTYMAKELYDWAISRYGNILLNLQPAVDDETNTIGINIDSIYTDDATHPNDLGIAALGAKMLQDLDIVYQNAVNNL